MRWKDTAEGQKYNRERRRWRYTGSVKYAFTRFMPAMSAHGTLVDELKNRGLELSPAEMVAIETEALVKTLKAFKFGLSGILSRRYEKRASYFEKFIRVSNPKGSRALKTYKKGNRGTVYKRIVFGEVKVRGPRRISLANWNPMPGRHGLTFKILRSKARDEIPKSFLVHGFFGMRQKEDGGYERVNGIGSKWSYGVYARNGKFYRDEHGWKRERIEPKSSTSGLEVLGERGSEAGSAQELFAEASEFLSHATLLGLDRMLRRRSMKRGGPKR